MIEDIVRRMRKRWSHLADDIEQEMRIAQWRAATVSASVPYIRTRARGAALDFLRSYRKARYGRDAPVFQDCDPDEFASEMSEPEHPPDMDADLALLRAVVLTDQRTVARAFGVSAPSICKRMRRIRKLLAVRV